MAPAMSKTAPMEARGTALVVDDEATNRLILKSLLKKNGYAVLQATDGAQAVEQFTEMRPDIVFMDVMMPVMDGYEATNRIKEHCGSDFVPVIFLTAITDEADLARCIEVGGDDFLTKPFSHTVLQAKIRAMERIRDLHREINSLYTRMQRDEEIAEQVFSGAVLAENLTLEGIRTNLRPADTFSGDVFLTARAPSGDLHALLGDFTGHGLAAALGALPAAEVFRTMTAKGFSGPQILNSINRKLANLLPTGMFMAVQFVGISHEQHYASICNCGMPDILILDQEGSVREKARSRGIPLGISAGINLDDFFSPIPIDTGERILLLSDGVTEAQNPENELFGHDNLEKAIARGRGETYALDAINRELNAFCRDAPQADDISLAEILCTPENFPQTAQAIKAEPPAVAGVAPSDSEKTMGFGGKWDFSFALHGSRLQEVDPIPLLINQIQELEGIQFDRRALFTVLTELYVNALDHGVLRLDSSLKKDAKGFAYYFTERERRLAELRSGWISFSLQVQSRSQGGRVVIRVEDSGKGFDFPDLMLPHEQETAFSGRGIRLVGELCTSLRYLEHGNQVEAVYEWDT